jgi:hypothetical protein
MKWIGQHIWSFISRFRTTVYLENLETSSEENVLVVDSDGKVTKNTTLGGSDLTLTNETDNRVITSTGGTGLNAEANLTYSDGAGLSLSSSTNSFPKILLENSSTGVGGPSIKFNRTEVGADDDEIGSFDFWSEDEGGSTQNYSEIACYIADATPGQEAGRLEFKVAEFDGSSNNPTTGLKIDGDTNADGEVDVTIGAGVGSTTTIASGNLVVGSTLNYYDSIELLQISGSSAASQPALILQNSHTGAVGPALTFQKTASGDDDDQLGKITFSGKDDGGASNTFAEIEGYIGDASAGAEEGKLILSVASHDGEVQPGLTMASGDAEDEVDITIGNGVNSVIDTAGIFRGGNIGVIQDTKLPVSPTQFITDSFRYAPQYNISAGGISPGTAGINYYAEVVIPAGYTATSCTMYAVDLDNDATLRCHSSNINSSTVSALASATTFSSGVATHDFDSNVDGDGSKTVIIELNPGDTTDIFNGGFITITKTT